MQIKLDTLTTILERTAAPRSELKNMELEELKGLLDELKDIQDQLGELSDVLDRRVMKVDDVVDELEMDFDEDDVFFGESIETEN